MRWLRLSVVSDFHLLPCKTRFELCSSEHSLALAAYTRRLQFLSKYESAYKSETLMSTQKIFVLQFYQLYALEVRRIASGRPTIYPGLRSFEGDAEVRNNIRITQHCST
jgi:hypothetical protein